MSITTPILFRDSLHFMRNHFSTVLLLALWMALLTVSIAWLVQMTSVTHSVEVTTSQFGISSQQAPFHLAPLISYPLLAASMLILIKARSQGIKIKPQQALMNGLAAYPALFALALVIDAAVLIGLALMIVPGLVVMLRCSLAPCIAITTRQGLLSALRHSWRLTAHCWRPLLAGCLLIRLATHLLLIWLLAYCDPLPLHHTWLRQLIIHTLLNLTHCWLLAYQFRLYMQLPQPVANKG